MNACEKERSDAQMEDIELKTVEKDSLSSSSFEFEGGTDTVKDVLKIFARLKDFLSQESYDGSLEEELAQALSEEEYENEHLKKKSSKIIDQVIDVRINDLKKMECGITITGETGGGKTTLLNKLIGVDLVTPKPWASTGKICRIYNATTMVVRLLDASGNLLRENVFEDLKKMTKELDKETSLKGLPDVHFVDICCPFQGSSIQGDVLLVDTPGIGESATLTKYLKENLPNAVSFVFVANASNSGGVQEDRLVEIMKTIINALPDMPCFEPCDVLIATTKWDLINNEGGEDHDDELEDNESEEHVSNEDTLWKLIVEKIKDIWGDDVEERIFKLSLVKVKKAIETKDEREFQRFTDALSKIIDKKRVKRYEKHLRFLEKTMQTIEIRILMRIATVTSEIDAQKLSDHKERLEKIKSESVVIKNNLQQRIREGVAELGQDLHDYIHSEAGKEKILNPHDKKQIKDGFFSPKEIRRRLMKGVLVWIMGTRVRKEFEKIDFQLKSGIEKIDIKLEYSSWVGEYEYLKKKEKWLSVSIAVRVYAFFKTIISTAGPCGNKNSASDIYYLECAENLKKDKITGLLQSIFDDHFNTFLHIFDEKVPKEINSIKLTINKIYEEREQLQGKLHDLRRLRDQISKIKEDVKQLLKEKS